MRHHDPVDIRGVRGMGHFQTQVDPNRFKQFELDHLCIWIKIEPNSTDQNHSYLG